jgi:hypothetical protein
MDLKEAKTALDAAIAGYQTLGDIKSPAQEREWTAKIKAAREAVSSAIIEGAKPCIGCGVLPLGMEQVFDRGRGRIAGTEYEIGCRSCPPFIHTDGTSRAFAARGGRMPRHTVEAWNEGPDFWKEVPVTSKMKPLPSSVDRHDTEAPLPDET